MALDTVKFIKKLVDEGYSHLCVVPCSFAKNVINESINNNKIQYVPCASEAVACSIAAGLKMSGKKPIIIVQSSGMTNMGSCITSLLKPYNITLPILTSWRTYNKDDSEIQHQHLATKLPKLLEAYGYSHTILNQNSLKSSIDQINTCDSSFTIGIIKKDTFTKIELNDEHKLNLSGYIQRSEFLLELNEKFKGTGTIFIGTTGNTSREMYSYMPDTNNFYMAGNMGGALSLGLGIAMGGKKVIVCGGDAEFVMHMGGLTTSGRYKDIDLTYILFDNEQNKSTGGQNTFQNHLDYISIAEASGFEIEKKTITDLANFTSIIEKLKVKNGIKFILVKCGLDDISPRPPIDVVKVNKINY